MLRRGGSQKEGAMQRLLWGLFLLVLVPLPSSAQTARDSWGNLKQLQPGQRIEVVDMKLKSLKGTFVSFSEGAISLRVKESEVAVPRPDVLRVSDREHSKRLRNALLGGAIGAGIGLAAEEVGTRHAQPISEYRGEYRAIGIILVPIGAGAGLGLGAAFPGYRTVYRAEKQRSGPQP